MKYTLNINQQNHQVDVEAAMPLLWVLRDELNLTGTKFGCGIASCGACTVLLDGKPVRSCSYPVSGAADKKITTIEGIASEAKLSAVQEAWIEHQVPQCGYCQSGMIMATEALLQENPNPSLEEIESAITNICRCGTYSRIRQAILSLAKKVNAADKTQTEKA
ncbi:MAG: (2Fe-2S)-binding protein [Microscillaceae bacterium]|nr:(2Fe-2S)-binding protein [Microscillaceae bacterium]